MGTEGTRCDGLHRRMQPDTRSGAGDRPGIGRSFAGLLCQLAGFRQPHARVCLYANMALCQHRRRVYLRHDAQRACRRCGGGRERPGRRTQKQGAFRRERGRSVEDADPSGRGHALPDALGPPQRPWRQYDSGYLLRQAGESALDLGYVAARSRSQMELHRVAESDRPVVGRRGDAHRERYAERVVHGDGRAVQGNLRGDARRDERVL